MEAEKLQKEQGTEEVKSKVLSFTEDPLKLTLFLVLVPVRAHVPCVYYALLFPIPMAMYRSASMTIEGLWTCADGLNRRQTLMI